jgi:MYXO-CTERM domain-containing protein
MSGKDMVEALGLDWRETYTDFITKNAAMDYDQHRLYPEVKVVDHTGSFPASGEGSGNDRPQGYGQNYIRLDSGGGDGDLTVTLHGESSVDWVVVLAETDGSTVLTSVSAIAADGEGSVTLPGYGDNDVYLIVSPLTADDTKYDYSWEAEVAAAGSDTGASDTGDGVGDGGPKNNQSGELASCGCASSSSAPAGALALGLVAVVSGRRRRDHEKIKDSLERAP